MPSSWPSTQWNTAMPSRAVLNALLFYAITLACALGVALLAPGLGEGALLLTMLTPTLVVVLMLTAVAREGRLRDAVRSLGLTTLGLKGWPFAIGGPAVIQALSFVVLSLTGLAVFGAPELSRSVAATVVSLTLGFVISTLFALTEEVGWRGYMLPRLLGLGAVPAMLLVGFLHGTWHLPLLLTTDLYHNTGNPVLVVPLFLVTLTLAGIPYGFLRLWTGSVWPAAITHSAVNITWNLMTDMTQTKSVMALEYIGGESGLVMIAALLIAGVALVWLMKPGRLRMAMMS